MKQRFLAPVLFVSMVSLVFGQAVIQNESSAFYSYGVADGEQMLPDSYTGVFDERKNGFLLQSLIRLSGEFQNRYDYQLEISSRARSGSSYLDLQLPSASPGDFALNLDSFWWRLYLSEIFASNLNLAGAELNINMKLGKFGISAADLGLSGFGLESVQNLLRLPSDPALSLETRLVFPGARQLVRGVRSSLTLDLAGGGLFDEDIQRLYDGDGGISNHGRPVVGEFAPQLFARLALNNYRLPFGELNAGAAYGYNANGIYSGHSAGAMAGLDLQLVEGRLTLPLGLSFAFYEKNLDVLAGYSGTELGSETTSLRESLRFGAATGIRFIQGSAGFLGTPRLIGEATISSSFSRINHIYRDPLDIINLGLDGKYFILSNLYAGGGFMLGTLMAAEWQTSEGVASSEDDFYREYRLMDNFGYEAYVGVELLPGLRLSLGFANMRGLSMTRGLESSQSGMVKLRQSGSELADMLWETRGVYLLTSIRL